VLVFLSIGSRRVEYLACTNLLMELHDRDWQMQFLIHDRDAKFPCAFDALLANDGIKVIRAPVRAPNASSTNTNSPRHDDRVSAPHACSGGPSCGAATVSTAVSAPPLSSPVILKVKTPPTGFSTDSPSPGARISCRIGSSYAASVSGYATLNHPLGRDNFRCSPGDLHGSLPCVSAYLLGSS
jgi:hypothetical protein